MINLCIHGTTLKEIKLIIFDKDGTLFELYPYWTIVAKRRAMNICHALNVDDDSLIDTIALIMGVDNNKKAMNPKGPIGIFNRQYIQDLLLKELREKGYPIDPQMITAAFHETDIYISQDAVLRQSLVPVRGLPEFLPIVAKRSKCAIFSYDQTKNLEHITNLINMENYFSFLLGGDLIKYPKPDPWGAVKIMQELNISPDNTILIGDSIHDIESGRKAGCKYVITRKSDISDLNLMEPISDFIIENYHEIVIK
jgi:phosphoglycolate phosphatase